MNCQRSMHCPRCGSTMIFKKFFDYGGHSWGWECLFCKEIIDEAPEIRRPHKEEWNEKRGSGKEFSWRERKE